MTMKQKIEYAKAEAERLYGVTLVGIQLRSVAATLGYLSVREAVDQEFAPNGALPPGV